MNAAEYFAINLQDEEPNFYSRIPHIISQITYDEVNEETGEVETKRLSIYAKELYRVIKSITNDTGACWQSRDKLAEECNMSAGQITSAKKELMQSFNELDGLPLISIKKMQKTSVKGGICKNKTYYDLITVTNIWRFNNAIMRLKNLPKVVAPSQNDNACSAPSKYDTPPQGTPSQPDTNKNPINKNPLSKEQQPLGKPKSVGSLAKKEDVVLPDKSYQSYNYLVKSGYKSAMALKMSMQYSPDDIKNASTYFVEQMAKNKKLGKVIPNECGYFTNILQKRYWEKKKKE